MAGRILPNLNGVGAHIALFEACSVFIHLTACPLADLLRDLFPQKLPARLLPSSSVLVATGGAKVAGWVFLTSPLKFRAVHSALRQAG